MTLWNAFVANLECTARQHSMIPVLPIVNRFPVAAQNGFDNVRSDVDLIPPKLADLHSYQLALDSPSPSFK